MFWSTLAAIIHSFPSEDGVELKVAKQFCVAGLKPVNFTPLHAVLLGMACALAAPGALANRLIRCWYNGSSAGWLAPTLASTAPAKAALGTVVAITLGKRKRNPSVSKKKNVLFLIIGPPTEAAHWFALENGRGVILPGVPSNEFLFIQLLEFMVRPFHQYWAFPWKLLVPDLVTY